MNFDGVYQPVSCTLQLSGSVVSWGPTAATIQEIRKAAGCSVGTAVVRFAAKHAVDSSPEMGREAKIMIGGKVVFRGVVGDVPSDISPDTDEVVLTLFDDKWLMENHTVGEPGIGTQPTVAAPDYGFKDVGFEMIFNKDGLPNKDPDALDFNTGSTAVFWTLKDILRFVFLRYVESDVATVDLGTLAGSAYEAAPVGLNLCGQTALQAVETVVKQTGESWGLVAGSQRSEFCRVRPGHGTRRNVYLFGVKLGARAGDAGEFHASEHRGGPSIRSAVDTFHVVSDRIAKETTFRSVAYGEGEAAIPALLVRAADFTDTKYVARFAVDVTRYEANGLGRNLSAGSPPKPWLPNLLTRLNAAGDDYVTAAELAADPKLLSRSSAGPAFVWLQVDGEDGRLCTGGFRISAELGIIDFAAEVELAVTGSDEPQKVSIEGWSDVTVTMTAATLLEVPEWATADEGGAYLPAARGQMITLDRLRPERRQTARLPKISEGLDGLDRNDFIIVPAGDAEEKYVDVTAQLAAVAASAALAAPAVECPLALLFPFFPTLEVGDLLAINGRDVGATGDEVVTEIVYNVHEAYETRVSATNVVGAFDAEESAGGAA